MDLDTYLQTSDVFGCHGQVTHTLTLRIDGTVQVRFANGRTAVADPERRTCRTPGITIPDSLWPEIAALSLGT
ncbi:MAG: hypothetical protein OSA99_02455 [Acidimicrobiales bacterium]|nr:hypothetical protein [Acidimicrobiales bacterium]